MDWPLLTSPIGRNALALLLTASVGGCIDPIVSDGESVTGDDGTRGDESSTMGSSTGSSTTSVPPGTSTTGITTTPPPTTMTDPTSPTTDPTTAGSTTDDGTSSGSTTGAETDGKACVPDPGDSECLQCVNEMCCEQLVECEADPDCDCLIDCINDLSIRDLPQCQELCDLIGLPPAVLALSGCQASMCGGVDC